MSSVKNPVHFYFDFSSPYGYLASERIEALVKKHGRTLVWHPILLGAVFKVSGQAPLTDAPIKGEYSIRDFQRSAREHRISYRHPDPFPIASVAAARATLWLRDNEDQSLATQCTSFIHSVFQAFYVHGADITDHDTLADIASSTGINAQLLLDAIASQSVKDALKTEVSTAMEAGIFGSPMITVDGEPFWGHDRLEQIDRWLASGGW